MQPLVQARTLLIFAVRAHCCLMVNLVYKGTPRAASAELLSCFSARAAGPWYVLMHRVTPPQWQDLALPFVELYKILTGPFLKLAEVPHCRASTWCACVNPNPNPTPHSFAMTQIQTDITNLCRASMVLIYTETYRHTDTHTDKYIYDALEYINKCVSIGLDRRGFFIRKFYFSVLYK